MFTTLLAVVVALALGHLAPALARRLRDYAWFRHWLGWLEPRAEGGARRDGALAVGLAVLPPLLVLALLQWLLADQAFGLPSLLLGVAVLFHVWGPRDLDRDVDAILEAGTGDARRAAASRLWPATQRDQARVDPPAVVGAVFGCALRRWFSVLLWFLLLGPVGALGYRLLAIVAGDAVAARLPAGMVASAGRMLAVLDWPVAQLLTLSLALVGNFQDVVQAWRQAGGTALRADVGMLAAVGRASVRGGIADEAEDYAGAGLASGSALVRELGPMPELREAMGLVWRALVLWLALLALCVVAGWAG